MADELRVASPYLRVLERQRQALIAALRPVVGTDDVEAAHRASARLSVRLDASPLSDATADAVDRGEAPAATAIAAARAAPPAGNGHGWVAALRLDGLPSQDIAAIEYRGVRAAQADEDRLAADLFAAPVATLTRIASQVGSGLVAADQLGGLRRTSRAVHDGAQGRVIFHAPAPDRLPALLEGLDAWVRDAERRHPPLVIAGVVHGRLLHWRPFEAGNGRVARLASRVALRATGGDPWGLAVPERRYAADPLRYVAEVAATIHRRTDLRPWIERTGEAVVEDLEERARRHGALPGGTVARAVHVCASLGAGDTITVPDMAMRTGLDRAAAMLQCNRLCWTGLLARDPGTHGLRYMRAATDVSVRAG